LRAVLITITVTKHTDSARQRRPSDKQHMKESARAGV
jgi:hypothetical protein